MNMRWHRFRVVCTLLGHKYVNHTPFPGVTPYLVCRRCGESGWLLP